MRIKLISFAIVIVALAVGATASNATLNSTTNVSVKAKKAGAPAIAKIVIDNTDSVNVPQRISNISIASSTAKWNGAAIPQCKVTFPVGGTPANTGAALSPGCPANTKVGTGTFSANTGTPGQPIPTDVGTVSGTLNIYNYKKSGGQSANLLLELISKIPVPNLHQFVLAGVSKSGTITSVVPNMAQLPPNLQAILSPGGAPRSVAMTHLETTIKAPKSKKPFLSLKSLSNLNFNVTLTRDNN